MENFLKDQIVTNLDLRNLSREKQEKIAQGVIKLSLEKALDELVEKMGPEKLKIWTDGDAGSEEKKEVMEIVFELFNKQLEKNIYEFRKRLGKEI